MAAKVVYWTTLEVGGKEGLISALEDANNFRERKKLLGRL